MALAQVFIGDTGIPAVCRLAHYEVPTGYPYPMGAGLMTHVADLMPLPIAEPGGPAFIAATMVPMLAEALRLMALRFPATAALPVWATIPEALVLAMRPRFRQTGPRRVRTSGRYIWMARLADARDDLAAEARPFPDLVRADAAVILPLYQDAYSPQIPIENVQEFLRGDT